MERKIDLIHRILFIFSIFILTASLIFYLSKWNSYPNEIGVHFGADGEYDVVASKFYGFYPHVIGGIVMAGLQFSEYLVRKKKTGLNISEKGEKYFKTELILALDIISLMTSLFFANWSRCVSLQIPLNLGFVNIILKLIFFTVMTDISLQSATVKKYREKEVKKNSDVKHRISRLTAWMLTVSGLIVIAVCWNRYPASEELYFNPDYYGLAYFANFDAYMSKNLLLIPHIAVILLLTAIEAISVKAVRSGKSKLILFTDRMRVLIGVFFFWWNLLLESELSIGIVSIIIFTVLLVAGIVSYCRQ